ncbi:DJ-1/PfpI family protein [Thalassobacillus pellis]|uniref:DJ-1/PfpI family protein n=1 Tax=Thalassobacillus pellis TaxID=748008 RepID=UPI0019622436|nr:DJ-1/PfpI family protein [Thalassobacillus pellis]MBM7553236.1 putative intracellular protease/amidase [Thalassobacillus pellis]
MKALFFLYDGYVDWEISPLTYMLNVSDIEVHTIGISEVVTHAGNFKVKVDRNIEAVDPADYEMIIIPGGEPSPFDKDERLLNLLKGFDEQGKGIAAICGGPTFLAAADVLRERKYSTSIDDNPEYAHYFNEKYMSEADVTVCENLITAEGNAYIEFAIAVGKELNIFEDREDELETVLFFKNQLRG